MSAFILPGFVHAAAGSAILSIQRWRSALRLRRHTCLHLACGDHLLSGWANVDIDGPSDVCRLDLTRPLPIRDGSMEAVYSEHFIEHIAREQAAALLREVHRVLEPGGVLRLSTPDLRRLLRAYEGGRLSEWHDMHWRPETPCRLLNEGMRWWGHQFVYDAPELETLLRETGFTEIRSVNWRESAHPKLRNLECRPFHGELIYECLR